MRPGNVNGRAVIASLAGVAALACVTRGGPRTVGEADANVTTHWSRACRRLLLEHLPWESAASKPVRVVAAEPRG